MKPTAFRRNRRLVLGYVLLSILLVVFSFLSLLLGSGMDIRTSFETLFSLSDGGSSAVILLKLRLPRILMNILVGAGLSVSGVLMQGMFLNPLADPHILGVSSGAGLGATVAMIFGFGGTYLGMAPVTVFAFAGGLGCVFLVFLLSHKGGRIQTVHMLLAGVAVGSFLSAMSSLILRLHADKLEAVYLWSLGSFSTVGWKHVWWCLPFVLFGTAASMFYAKDLNLLSQGEENAALLGVSVKKVRAVLMFIAAGITSSAVSATGSISSVGLMVPHILRSLYGPDHRHLIPLSALGGGLFLLIMDTLARTVAAPQELPVGVLTALCGGPFFVYILRRGKRGGSHD